MAAHAADAIAAGTPTSSCWRTARRPAPTSRGRRTANLDFGARGPIQFEVPYGHTLIAKYAMAARRHMHEYGTTMEQLAEIAVSARANAGLNPDAYVPRPDHRRRRAVGPMIADPFTKLAVLHPLRRRRAR